MSAVRTFGGELKPPLDEDLLEHHGIKGMHWGARKHDYPGASTSTNHQAHKDAKEFARAKMFFGKGAGTRRKLITAKVEAKKSRDSSYSKAFDHHLARQDMSSHASKARSERARKDTAESGKKTTMAILRRTTGQYGNAAAIVAVTAGGMAYLSTPHGRRLMEKYIGAPYGR